MKRIHQPRGIFLSAAYSQIVFIAVSLILLLIFCALANSSADPDVITRPLSLCALYVAGCAGGVASVKLSGDGIVSGALSGLLSAAVVFVMSLLPFPETGMEITYKLLIPLMLIPAAVIGSVIGKKNKTSKRKRHRR